MRWKDGKLSREKTHGTFADNDVAIAELLEFIVREVEGELGLAKGALDLLLDRGAVVDRPLNNLVEGSVELRRMIGECVDARVSVQGSRDPRTGKHVIAYREAH